MEAKFEPIRIERIAARGQEQTLVEGEVALPGGIREEAAVISCEARCVLSGTQTQSGRLSLDGAVVFQVLYRQGDNTIRVLEANSAFSHAMAMEGIEENMRPLVQVQVAEASAQPVSGRIRLRAAVDVQADVFSQETIPVVTDVEGVQSLQTKVSRCQTARHTVSGRSSVLLREEFELEAPPAISETLYARAMPSLTSISGGEGKATVEGEVALEVLHAGETEEMPLVITRHSFPFEQSVDLEGEGEAEKLKARLQVQDVVASSVDLGDGQRVLRVETVLDAEVFALEEEELTFLQDAYTLSGEDLELTGRNCECFSGYEQTRGEESDKLILNLPPDAPPVGKVLLAVLSPTLTSMEPVGGRVVLEGILDVQTAYIPQEGDRTAGMRKNLPFRIAFAGSLPQDARLMLKTFDVQAEGIAADRIELKYRMALEAQSVSGQPIRLSVDAKSRPAAASHRGLSVVWPQKGESLWSVAKRLRVSVESLKRLNPGVENAPLGKGLVALRKA